MLVVDVVSKTRGINDRQSNSNAILLEFYGLLSILGFTSSTVQRTNSSWFDPDGGLEMGILWLLDDFVCQHLCLA